MRWQVFILTAAGMLAGALALPRGARAVSPTGPEPLARRLEVARLRAHFDSVDGELRHADALQLMPSQRRGRATLIGWLQEYRDAGRFPRNDRFPDRAMPFFRDGHGSLCAMAYLIERSGRRDLVDRIALTRNNAFIAELANDPELRVWLDSVGLSVTEAARIQHFTSRGGVSSRAETLVMLSDPDYRLEHAERSEIVITLSSPVAVVSSSWVGRGSY